MPEIFQKKKKKQSKKEKESRQSAGRDENARLSRSLKNLNTNQE
jgi:hypothetical protein